MFSTPETSGHVLDKSREISPLEREEGYGERIWRKGVLRREWKTLWDTPTTDLGAESEPGDGGCLFALHCIALHCIPLQCSAAQCSTVQCIAVYCTVLHCSAMEYSAVHSSVLHCIALQCNAIQCSAMQCNALHCITLPYSRGRCHFNIVNNSVSTNISSTVPHTLMMLVG